MPVAGRHIEGVTDYNCSGGDCHLLVYQNQRLYDLYQAQITSGMATGGTFTGDCLVVWDLTKDYPGQPVDDGRQLFARRRLQRRRRRRHPMAPLIIQTSDIQAGVINHAMRFTLPNAKIRKGIYVIRRRTARRAPADRRAAPTRCRTARACASRLVRRQQALGVGEDS